MIYHRYKNRRIWSKEEHQNATLKDILAAARAGKPVKVLDKAKNDITAITLLQALVNSPYRLTNERILEVIREAA
jgi:polyhydroxyalkanoate synthesis regulator protein